MRKRKRKGKSKKRYIAQMIILSLLLLTISPVTETIAAEEETYQIINVTGFNEDVIAEKVLLITDATFTTSTSMDSSNNVYYTNTVSKKAHMSQPGLPDDRWIHSEATQGVNYLLQQYSRDNVLFFSSSHLSGKLTLTKYANEETAFQKLYLLTASGHGDSYMEITVNFTDGSSTVYHDIVIKDWHDGTNYATRNIGRMNRWSGEDTGEPLEDNGEKGNPRMYETVLELSKEDQKKSLSSIGFHTNIGKNAKTRAGIFAVTGKLPKKTPDIPLLDQVKDIMADSATISWFASDKALRYAVDVATDKSFSPKDILPEYDGKKVNATCLQLSGLTPNTNYYYRVRAENEYGASENLEAGCFKTLYCGISILKQPESVTVEENNINEKLSVTVSTDSKKELNYTWQLSTDASGTNIIQCVTTGPEYEVPRDLVQGDYYVSCEIGNADVEAVRTNLVKVHVQVIYQIDISWGDMKFEFGSQKEWNPENHTYQQERRTGWNLENVDGKNNKITVRNHSSSSLVMSLEYISKKGAFNEILNEDTSVQGRLYETNADARKASGYLAGLKDKLTFGKLSVQKVIATDKWSSTKEAAKQETYFAFSGMPDLGDNKNTTGKLSGYQTVGHIQIVFGSEEKSKARGEKY